MAEKKHKGDRRTVMIRNLREENAFFRAVLTCLPFDVHLAARKEARAKIEARKNDKRAESRQSDKVAAAPECKVLPFVISKELN